MSLIQIGLNNINLSNTIQSAFDNAVKSAIPTTLALVKDKWQSEAQRRLNSTRPQYLMGLDADSISYPYEGSPLVGAITLKGKLPNMIEQGYPSYDMKIGFEKSPKRHDTKGGGWYLTIPIRHGTPSSFMWGKPMSEDIYSQAKKLKDRQSLSVKGGQQTSWTGYQHKNNINDGLTRIIQQNSNGSKSSQYVTFRRVGSKSDPMSWMHPGYTGVHISKTLTPYAEQTFKKAIEANLSVLLS